MTYFVIADRVRAVIWSESQVSAVSSAVRVSRVGIQILRFA
jgi:hypothetical protein